MNLLNELIRARSVEKYFIKKYFDFFLLGLSFVIAIYLGWSITGIAVGLFILYVFLNPLPSRYFSRTAFVLLILTLITLGLGQDSRAEKISVAAYGFLVLAVIMTILEKKQKRKER